MGLAIAYEVAMTEWGKDPHWIHKNWTYSMLFLMLGSLRIKNEKANESVAESSPRGNRTETIGPDHPARNYKPDSDSIPKGTGEPDWAAKNKHIGWTVL